MKLIALETSAEACSAALWTDGEVIERFVVAPRGHSELILPMLEEVLAEGDVARSAIDALAFGRGPGSFTGVRIATGVAQGIAYALDVPVVPVSTLEILAQGVWRQHGEERVLAAFDARMGEVYWAACARGAHGLMELMGDETLCPPQNVPLPEAGGWCGAGGGWESYRDELSQRLGRVVTVIRGDALCHARDAAVIGAARFAAGDGVDAASALPVYLRNRVATPKAT